MRKETVGPATLYLGDCRTVLATIPDCSIDSIVTDPPYGLSKEPDIAEVLRHWLAGDDYHHKGGGFMGKSWDSFVPGPAVWRECLRVLKPGGHLLAFAGTRTMDLMCMAIRLAGFEMRDAIGNVHDGGGAPLMAWVYGSGFPKSHNLSGEWEGWGTALKPAWEPILLARKPLIGTVAQNVCEHGTGALNIAACRVTTDETLRAGAGGIPCRHDENVPRGRGGEASAERRYTDEGGTDFAMKPGPRGGDPAGRWPANVIHDGSDEVIAAFPAAPGQLARSSSSSRKSRNVYGAMARNGYGGLEPRDDGDQSAARFFYCAKASRTDRNEGIEAFARATTSDGRVVAADNAYQRGKTERANTHPTVKPTELMAYLCRLVTPPGGIVLDPFMGSGSTGKAAMREGFQFIGVDLTPEYLEIAKARIEHELSRAVGAVDESDPRQKSLFGDFYEVPA